MPQFFVKDPQAILDYKFDWSDWLAAGETIESYTLDPQSGIAVTDDEATDSDTSVTVWLSGGSVGSAYTVGCYIVTSDGRQDERTIIVEVKQR